MKVYLQGGILSLYKMKEHYNKFVDGGDKKTLTQRAKEKATQLLGEYLYETVTPDVSTETTDRRELGEKVLSPLRPLMRPVFLGPYKRPEADSLSEVMWKRYLTDSDTARIQNLPRSLKEDIGTFISDNLSNSEAYESHRFFGDQWDPINGVTLEGKWRGPFYDGQPVPVNEYDIYPQYRETGELTPASALGNFRIQVIDNGNKAVVTDRYDFSPNQSTEQDSTIIRKARRLADKVFYPFEIRDTVTLSRPVSVNKFDGNSTRSQSLKNPLGFDTFFDTPENPIPLRTPAPEVDQEIISYVNATENPDSVGWDPVLKGWRAPKNTVAYDKNNLGMGIDRKTNPDIRRILKRDILGEEYITDEDMQWAQKRAIKRAEESKEERYKYVQKTKGKINRPSKIKDLLTIGSIYNHGQGYVANNHFEDPALIEALRNGTDKEYMDQVDKYWRKRGRNERVRRSREYFSKQQ